VKRSTLGDRIKKLGLTHLGRSSVACLHDNLMAQTRLRLEQEIARLGGHYAHVFDEIIDTRRGE
jgi:hypothetical protein